jgi:4a-hydroxytetrahydrobiopterin dehydratase
MTKLKDRKCEACRPGAPLATEEEIAALLPEIPQWEIIDEAGIRKLTRSFKFNNFTEALSFTIKMSELADELGHHPTLITEWGKVTVIFFSKKIKGLHVTDFIMAAKTDALL